MGEGRRLQQVTRHGSSQLQPRVPKPAATLWPGASNPAPPATQLPVCPSPSTFLDSASINRNSKKVVIVLTVDTKRESLASRTKPILFVPINSSCAAPLGYREKGRGATASQCHRKLTCTVRTVDEIVAQTASSRPSVLIYMLKKKRSEGGKRGAHPTFVNFTLFSLRLQGERTQTRPDATAPSPCEPSCRGVLVTEAISALPHRHARAHTQGHKHHNKLPLDFSLCNAFFLCSILTMLKLYLSLESCITRKSCFMTWEGWYMQLN